MYRDLPSEGPYKLRDSDFHVWSQILNPEFDNDNNPYLKMKFYNFVNENGVSTTEEIPMVKCTNEYIAQDIIDTDYYG